MNESENKSYLDLVARADRAKTLSGEITVLMAYDADRQRAHITFESPSRYDREGYPEEYAVRMLVEMGRQVRLQQLRTQLQEIVGVTAPAQPTFVPCPDNDPLVSGDPMMSDEVAK